MLIRDASPPERERAPPLSPLPHSASPPLATGRSPFHVKGSAYVGTVGQYDALVPGGFRAVVDEARRRDSMLAAFLSERFFPSVWYDVFPMAAADTIAAELAGLSFQQFGERAVKHQVAVDMNGIYRTMLRALSPQSVFSKLVLLQGLYFDFGKTKTTRPGPGQVDVNTQGVPLALARWFAFGAAAYTSALAEIAGATGLSITFKEPVTTGEVMGFAVCDVAWAARWRTARE